MLDIKQFRERIVRPVLHGLGMWNEYAEELMLGTCAVESAGGTYLVQLNNGPALGIYQMEPKTHDDIWAKWLPNNPAIAANLMNSCMMAMKPRADMMVYNLYYATAMARLQYWRVGQGPIPATPEEQALYWVKYYNCGGAGTVEKYLEARALFLRLPVEKPVESKLKKVKAR